MDKLVVLKTYYHKHDAQIAQGLLNDAGILSNVSADDVGGFRPHVSLSMNNVRLMVREADVERAKEILRVLDDSVDEDQLKEIAERAVHATPQEDEKTQKKKYNIEPSLVIPIIIALLFAIIYVIKKVDRQALDYGIFEANDAKTPIKR